LVYQLIGLLVEAFLKKDLFSESDNREFTVEASCCWLGFLTAKDYLKELRFHLGANCFLRIGLALLITGEHKEREKNAIKVKS
jgi:positive regulator of sigma E activity